MEVDWSVDVAASSRESCLNVLVLLDNWHPCDLVSDVLISVGPKLGWNTRIGFVIP